MSLSEEIPGLRNTVNSLLSHLTSILTARATSFAYNATSKQLSVSGFLLDFTIVSDFVSMSNVYITYVGTLSTAMI